MTTPKVIRIFLSYRRGDSAAIAGRLFDRLVRLYGGNQVFRDLYTIAGGESFADVIDEHIASCDVLLALIGNIWLDARDAQGQRRLDDPRDFVAREIAQALSLGKRVIPVLIEDAKMPVPASLPAGLAKLATLQAVSISDSHFEYDFNERLVRAIEKPLPAHSKPSPKPPVPSVSRKVVLSAIVGFLAAITAFAGWYWDAFYRPHVEHYANVILRWGFPEGVGPLTHEQVSHRSVSLKFTKRGKRGPVEEVRVVNSRDAFPPSFSYAPPLSFRDLDPLSKVGLVEIFAVGRVTFEADANGFIINQSGFSAAGRLVYTLHYAQPDTAEYKIGAFSRAARESGITHIRFVRPKTGPSAGLNTELLFFDAAGTPRSDHDGSFGYRRTLNAQGLPAESFPLGADGKPAIDREGAAKGTFTYDEQGNLVRFATTGPDGKPVLSGGGVFSGTSEIKMRYDVYGNLAEMAFFGKDGQLQSDKYMGAAVRTIAYDARGNIVENGFLGSDRQPVRGFAGFATQKIVWDDKGSSTESYFGADGKLTRSIGRVFKSKILWDNRGNPTEISFLDENDRRMRDDEGCAKRTLTYDKDGSVSEIACLDEDDRPLRDSNGVAAMKRVNDERGNVIEEMFFGPSGKPELYDEPYVKVHKKYNAQGNEVEATYYDAKDRPVKNRDGYAKSATSYDLYGNIIEVAFFDERGQPTARRGAYAKIVRTYDERRRMIEETTLDINGKLAVDDEGHARAKFSYDERGYRVEAAYYDERDLPARNKNGCSKERSKYSQAGQLIESACYGTDGSGMRDTLFGCVKRRFSYGPAGYRSRWDCFDENDQLTQSALGYASSKYIYDDFGRQTKSEFFDANGSRVSTHVRISEVEAGSIGERAGLRVGDVVVAYDGREVEGTSAFEERELQMGERPRRLTLKRDGKMVDLDLPSGRLRGIKTSDSGMG
jgi:hypothetical protein